MEPTGIPINPSEAFQPVEGRFFRHLAATRPAGKPQWAVMKEVKIPVQNLKLGMYVARLDRPWSETPIALQGFQIQSVGTISLLQQHCSYVYIDVRKSEVHQPTPYQSLGSTDLAGSEPAPGSRQAQPRAPLAPLPERRHSYQDATPVTEEFEAASETHTEVSAVVAELMDDVKAGKKLVATGVKDAVRRLMDTVMRNPDAMLWLRMLKHKDAYSYNHAVNVSVLAIALGRHMGLPPHDIRDLGIGALLFDIGKMKVPAELLSKPGRLTPEEQEVVRLHVEHSVQIMQETPGLSGRAIEMALTHHERFCGGGYPNKFFGAKIPLFGRIGGLVDTYDAITSDRPYASAISPHEAIRRLYDWSPRDFQEELVELFIQCLGVYPTGSLVQLNTGQVGVVIQQSRVRHLRPKVMLVLDENKVAYRRAPVLDLMDDTETDDGVPVLIAHALEPGAYGIRPEDYYLPKSTEQEQVQNVTGPQRAGSRR